ncbi:MAG: acetyl-CoA C-acetyltransferase [Myxococcota bacterium]|nr:acetyl-CoA C-acetyltransferase [Myxococcota bacterium]
MEDVVIVSAKRTPIGKFMGSLSGVSAPNLGAVAIKSCLETANVSGDTVEQVIMGNVLQAGLGQAPARQAAIYAGLPKSVGAITLHKVCGSGLRTIMDASNGIKAGEWSTVVAGGMENMSQSPHILMGSRNGYKMGNTQMVDSMVHDGLWDPYGDKHMGNCAELCASKYEFSREAQDAFALESYNRAQKAATNGLFDSEMATVLVPQRKGDPVSVTADDEPFAAPLDKMAKLRPAFQKDGTVTAANASKLNDGGAAVLVAASSKAKDLGLKPMARIVSYASHAQDPEWFTTAPVTAAQKALEKAELTAAQIDAWEINEAFAVVTMASIKDLKLDPAKVNPKGGAVALGHPIGCSGTRILVTLLHHLRRNNLKYGCASICIGGGEAAAIIVENLTV